MNKAAVAQQTKTASFAQAVPRVLQRQCACGNHTAAGGECAECSKKKTGLQRKLAIGASNDPLEQEADRVADQVMALPAHSAVSDTPPHIQRFSGQSSREIGEAPATVDQALASPGRPLEPKLLRDMENRFGHDFSRVRVHSGAMAEQSTQDVSANAYTVGHDIVFGASQFRPGTQAGRLLIAHELAHVMQQSASTGILFSQSEQKRNSLNPHETQESVVASPILRAQPNKKTLPKKPKPTVPQICGRPSRKVAGNLITKVNLDVGANTLMVEWKDPSKAPPGSAGTHAISPGAGRCCVDCNDDTVSQTSGSLCTPKGGSWPVSTTGCVLSGHPTAKNPTYFQRGGVAIHSGNTSSPPQSHGCARTSVSISELIHDNVVPEQTIIASTGTWAGKKCYPKEASKSLSNRSDICDGDKLKNKKAKGKAKPSAKPNAPEQMPPEPRPKPEEHSNPVADARAAESDSLTMVEAPDLNGDDMSGMPLDGSGPNNEASSDENIGDAMLADIDMLDGEKIG